MEDARGYGAVCKETSRTFSRVTGIVETCDIETKGEEKRLSCEVYLVYLCSSLE